MPKRSPRRAALHPQAPTPQVYRTGSLFQDIRSHRERMGDAASVQGLAAASPEAGSGDADGDWRSLARHHGRREHMSDTIQAVASLFSQHNCLSLALDEAALLSASALLPMWTRGWWTWAGYKADAGERLCLAAVHLTECSWPGSGEAGSCT
ncbi:MULTISPECIES: hypothetical protein [Streptomyces]|nr:hypothetical protein [Streptomyces nanshensis]